VFALLLSSSPLAPAVRMMLNQFSPCSRAFTDLAGDRDRLH
jgi:hypothetical protein